MSWCAQFYTALLKTSDLFTSRPSYKYCVLFLVSHLSGALGVHGKHLFP